MLKLLDKICRLFQWVKDQWGNSFSITALIHCSPDVLSCSKSPQQKGLQEYFWATDILVMLKSAAVNLTELKQKCITLWPCLYCQMKAISSQTICRWKMEVLWKWKNKDLLKRHCSLRAHSEDCFFRVRGGRKTFCWTVGLLPLVLTEGWIGAPWSCFSKQVHSKSSFGANSQTYYWYMFKVVWPYLDGI